jgi:P27 family predicted phage terminase small subunit
MVVSHKIKPERKAPPCPEHLDKEAKAEWRRMVRVLLRIRVLTEADGIVLANLCQAWSTMTKAQAKLNESGLLLKTPSGYVQQNPLLGIVNANIETITKLSREFGLTPASRVRIEVEPEPKPEGKMAKLLRERWEQV